MTRSGCPGNTPFPSPSSCRLTQDAIRVRRSSRSLNLLPDNDAIRNRAAGQIGAEGADAYSLLAVMGRDCVGALQFLPVDVEPTQAGKSMNTGRKGERLRRQLCAAAVPR